MKLRIVGSFLAIAMFTGVVPAQGQPRSPKEKVPSEPNGSSAELTHTAKYSAAPNSGVFVPGADRYRSFAWITADYTLSSVSRSTLPALVTSSPLGVAQANAGVLGRTSTNLLFGDGNQDTGLFHGVRLTSGITYPAGVSFEVSGFFMHNGTPTFRAAPDGGSNATIARPFFEPITSQEAAQLVAFPNRFTGAIDIHQRTTLWGIETNVFEQWNLGIPIIGGVGLRYAYLNDAIEIEQRTTALNAPALTFLGNDIPLADSLRITDSFRSHNHFIGPQMLIRYDQRFGVFALGMAAKLAIGSTQQSLHIAGQTDQVSAGGSIVQSANAGFLTTSSNIGSFTRSEFSVMPEINLKLGYGVTPNLNVFVGYDFLAWTNVVRAGEQIDRTVNLTKVPSAAIFTPNFGGPNRPTPLFQNSDLVVHSLRVGLEWKY